VLTRDSTGAVDAAAAAAIARAHFAIEGVATPLPGELDDNFRLDARDGCRYVLKVMHPGRERAFVSLLAEALRHLAGAAPALALPRVVPARGSPFAETVDARGASRYVLLLTWIEGTPLAEARPRTDALHESLGRVLGDMDRGLASFSHPAAARDLKWDLARAPWIRGELSAIVDERRRGLVARCLDLFDTLVASVLARLRRSVIHGDANDWNALVAGPHAAPHSVVSIIDFGDIHEGLVAAEPAVAAAYALLGQRDPLAAAAAVTRGYHATHPLDEDEIEVLFPLILARLAVSVTNSALVAGRSPADPYVTISEAPAWEALERLSRVTPALAHATFRAACGLPAVRGAEPTTAWLRALQGAPPDGDNASVIGDDLERECLVLDLGVSSLLLGADPAASATGALTQTIRATLTAAGKSVAVGRYLEARALYKAPAFESAPGEQGRTIHLGLDFFVDPGTPVRAPLDGVVHLVADNAAPFDYGPLVVLRHEPEPGVRFFTLYGHLSDDTLPALEPGQRIARGDAFARVGAPPSNGDWPPHLHLQVMLDLLGLGADFPGVARASDLALWTSVSPDPNLLARIPAWCFPPEAPTRTETHEARRRLLGPNLSLAYRQPLKIVRGWMQHLYDDTGREYLDTFNNVPLVGHSHPRVVRAAQEQLALLNTNTRYLHDNAARYAERLTALMPEPLRVCFFVNSGSEANELALRLARAYAGQDDVIVLEHAYHGNTRLLVDVSPYKFDGPGGAGRKPFVHVVPLPDDFRGPWRRDDPGRGAKYARAVGDVVSRLQASGRGPATFIAETLPSVGGQIVLPPGYLREAYRAVRAAGGVVVADEVQVGFGRLGTHFWGFETQEVVPDVVVLGKPIGNAFPLAAVVTTPAVAASFDNGMEYFSTFGGNPVACAVGLAVLDVVRDERLQERAGRVGHYLRSGLERLAERHALIGDVRGSGLFLGVEFVRDRATLEPAAEESSYIVNRLRERGILSGLDGPYDNVLKIRPPLVFAEADADRLVATLGDVLGEDPIRPRRT
jgi:4-aminobutyrate aminotransferase-like enzyme/Ser/Thr protein kinase RdoA (MazF antagonist)/murein DD-endopeptidase MepM/ murein hydrolase activator NlpD